MSDDEIGTTLGHGRDEKCIGPGETVCSLPATDSDNGRDPVAELKALKK